MKFRKERDSLGERQVPAEAYYGIHTVRAMENFQITGMPISHYATFLRSLAAVKRAAAMINMEMGLLDERIGNAIVQSAREIEDGSWGEQFPVDVIQGGAGTSTNMNMNEVIANRALELLGHDKGQYEIIHPLNHVNLSQSTNDVYPTAFRIALILNGKNLIRVMEELKTALLHKGKEFAHIIKMGRTQLQDAVPITLGSEFAAWSTTVGEDIERLHTVLDLLCEVNIGGTAIGTGINTIQGYAENVCRRLGDLVGLPLRPAADLVEATSDMGAYVMLSGILKRIAIKLSKICNDLRLLSSGPYTGLHEINLPPRQAGSSIMPGKINPVIPEVVNQICYQVIGNDLTITFAAEAGQLELNVFVPVLALNLFESLDILTNGIITLTENCIKGITVNEERCRELVSSSLGGVTALAPIIGYEAASALAKKSQEEGKSIEELLEELHIMTAQEYQARISPDVLLHPRNSGAGAGGIKKEDGKSQDPNRQKD